MRKYAVLNYLCFVAYSVFVLVAMCSGWQWMANGAAVVRLLLSWLVYGIFSTAWIQIAHPPRVSDRGLFYLFVMSRF
jgi:hypothetical protein